MREQGGYMIIWLASYPRSGNTLLRQILKGCFRRDSHESLGGRGPAPSLPDTPRAEASHLWGHLETAEEPRAFYDRASRSEDTFFVKTHEFPSDGQRAIYVVRDGRLALDSFVAFQQRYHPRSSSLLSLVCGDHLFGDWSDHFRRWQTRPGGQTLLVRFEELVSCNEELLERLREFIGHRGSVRRWESPTGNSGRPCPRCSARAAGAGCEGRSGPISPSASITPSTGG